MSGKKSIQRVKKRIRKLTSRSKSIPMEIRIEQLNQYSTGWFDYYALAGTPTIFKELDEWIRRRLRMCQWKEWKKPKKKVRKLIGLGTPKEKAYEWDNSRKKYCRIAKSPILQRILTNSHWELRGLKSLYVRYSQLRQT